MSTRTKGTLTVLVGYSGKGTQAEMLGGTRVPVGTTQAGVLGVLGVLGQGYSLGARCVDEREQPRAVLSVRRRLRTSEYPQWSTPVIVHLIVVPLEYPHKSTPVIARTGESRPNPTPVRTQPSRGTNGVLTGYSAGRPGYARVL